MNIELANNILNAQIYNLGIRYLMIGLYTVKFEYDGVN